jgi:hypothetical protein
MGGTHDQYDGCTRIAREGYFGGYEEIPSGSMSSYKLKIGNHWYDHAKVRRVVRTYLEVGQEKRSPQAKAFAAYLYADMPTRTQLQAVESTLLQVFAEIQSALLN